MTLAIRFSVPRGKLRAPFMGVPVPGERPIVLVTEQVRGTLAGVTVTDAAIVEARRAGVTGGDWYSSNGHRIGDAVRALEVTFTHGRRGHGRVVLYDRCGNHYDQMILRMRIREWAEAQRERRAKPKAPTGRTAEIARQVKRLEKEKRGLYVHRPVHPLIPREVKYAEANYWRDAEANHNYWRETVYQWYAEKPARKRLAAIAAKVLKSRATATTGYRLLREGGFEFAKFSEQPVRGGHRQRDFQDDYWRHVYEFVRGMQSRRNIERLAETEKHERGRLESHAEARLEYLAAKRQSESIDAQIGALKEMAAETSPHPA